jgi:hypothetical protein
MNNRQPFVKSIGKEEDDGTALVTRRKKVRDLLDVKYLERVKKTKEKSR